MSPTKINFKVYQGSTFKEVLRWASSTIVYKPITNITKDAPAVITAIGHGVPNGWFIKVTNVTGMKEINSDTNSLLVTSTTADTITINALNSLGFAAYTSGGIVSYYEPINLTGFTARMQIRSKLEDTVVIHELTTENAGIVIDNTEKTIKLNITPEATALFTFTNAVYSLELISSGGEVTPFSNGSIMLIKEVTR